MHNKVHIILDVYTDNEKVIWLMFYRSVLYVKGRRNNPRPHKLSIVSSRHVSGRLCLTVRSTIVIALLIVFWSTKCLLHWIYFWYCQNHKHFKVIYRHEDTWKVPYAIDNSLMDNTLVSFFLYHAAPSAPHTPRYGPECSQCVRC